VKSIGDWAFDLCSSLSSIVWNAKNCESISFGVIISRQITSFTFGNEVEHIPARLCSGMTKLTSITIPESVTSIGSSAFDGCTSLPSITCKAKNPPTLGLYNTLSSVTAVYVPAESVDLYRAADEWSYYADKI
jgi:hypothetical protein